MPISLFTLFKSGEPIFTIERSDAGSVDLPQNLPIQIDDFDCVALGGSNGTSFIPVVPFPNDQTRNRLQISSDQRHAFKLELRAEIRCLLSSHAAAWDSTLRFDLEANPDGHTLSISKFKVKDAYITGLVSVDDSHTISLAGITLRDEWDLGFAILSREFKNVGTTQGKLAFAKDPENAEQHFLILERDAKVADLSKPIRIHGMDIKLEGLVRPEGLHLKQVARLDGSKSFFWEVQVYNLPALSIISAWNVYVAEKFWSSAYSSISTLPKLELVRNTSGNWCLPIWIRDGKHGDAKAVDYQNSLDDNLRKGLISARVLALQPCDDIDQPDSYPFVKLTFKLQSHRGALVQVLARLINTSFCRDGSIDPAKFDSSRITRNHEQFLFSTLAQNFGRSSNPQFCRLGAMDLEFGEYLESDGNTNPTGDLCSNFAAIVSTSVGALSPLPHIRAQLRCPINSLQPGGQDAPADELLISEPTGFDISPLEIEAGPYDPFYIQTPVVIPIACSTGQGQAGVAKQLRLESAEFNSNQTPQSLSLRVSSKAASTTFNGSIVILDTQPLLIERVNIPNAGTSPDGISELANWSNRHPEGAAWRIRNDSNTYDIGLPPQSIGEATEVYFGADDVAELQSADFRFSPGATIKINRSEHAERFSEAPWNSRRRNGRAYQSTPGSPIAEITLELLYGLACRIKYAHLKLVEIGALLGYIPGRLPSVLPWSYSEPQRQKFEELKRQWAINYRRFFSRLGILEPHDYNQTQATLVKDDVTFELRQTAKSKNPITMEPQDYLAGGLKWLLGELAHDVVVELPKSTSGQVSGVYLSSLGGYGCQTAVFANGYVTVTSKSNMGRANYVQVTVLGRINSFWNQAKHVIVYERTVSRYSKFSQQNPPPYHKQDQLAGRAVLRKIDEYVEITEPFREFPDGPHSKTESGCFRAIEFKTTKMGALGSITKDPSGEWTAISLWNDSIIEKKPHVVLHLDTIGENSTVAAALLTPQRLKFYTSAKYGKQEPDPHKWPSQIGIDYQKNNTTITPSANYNGASVSDTPGHAAVDGIPADFNDFTLKVERPPTGMNVTANRVSRELLAFAKEVTIVRSVQANHQPLRLVTAVVEPPDLHPLKTNLEEMRVYFTQGADLLENKISTTPFIALLDRAGASDALKSLGVRVPTKEFADQLIPDFSTFGNLKLSDVLPDFAGLRIEDLLKGAALVDKQGKNYRIRQGIDKSSLTVWIEAEIHTKLGRNTLFSAGPLSMVIDDVHFDALARVEARVDGTTQRKMNATIRADWELVCMGQSLVIFDDTSLSFTEDGRFRFDFSPAKVKLQSVLRFISDLMDRLSYDSEDGFSVKAQLVNGLPQIKSLLNLPLPDMGGGAFAISGLRLGGELGLSLNRIGGVPEFRISAALSLGRELAPFAISIMALTGAGYLEFSASYGTKSGVTLRVKFSILAGAGLAFSLAGIKGSVYMLFGINCSYEKGGRTNSFSIAAVVIIKGEVDIYGIASARITLSLELRYLIENGKSKVQGTGRLSVSIKICWCFTLEVSKEVTCNFVGGKSGQSFFGANLNDLAKVYVGMLE